MSSEKILDSGTLYWFKSQRRGKVAIPLNYLTDEQKNILSTALALNKYQLANPYQKFTTHYMWADHATTAHFLLDDIKLLPEIKRKLSPAKSAGKKSSLRITLSDITELQTQFKDGQIDEYEVEKMLVDAKWTPWLEREWKLMRESVIKSHCEHCNSSDSLVLQHTIQPRKPQAILYQLVGERWEEFESYKNSIINQVELPLTDHIQKVPVCPKCGSSQIHLRERGSNKGTYVCNKSHNYQVCKNKFTNPSFGYCEKDIKEAERKRSSTIRDMFCRSNGLMRIAVEKTLAEIIVYLKLDHIKTLCSKCAFKEDRPFDKHLFFGI